MNEEEKRMNKLSTIITIITIIVIIVIVIAIFKDLHKAPYDRPAIPKGFYHVTGEWNTGYVISDSSLDENNPNGNNGNQFVWIPVKNIKDFQRTISFGNEIVKPNEGYVEPIENDEDYEKMIESVKKYGGFYIGRYETGDAEALENRTKLTEPHEIAIKKDQIVYNYIAWGNYENSAVELAKAMYKDFSSVVSTLTYGIQWDATMNFIKEDVDLNNCNSWGNYLDNTNIENENVGKLQKTGTNETWKAKNIYDLAGNVGEWTMESNLTTMKVIRGGAYNSNGNAEGYPVAGRFDNYPNSTNSNVGFRVALYLK